MRNLRACVMLVLALLIAAVCICAFYSLATPAYPSHGPLPADLEQRSGVLSDWRKGVRPDGGFAITFTGATASPPLALVLYDTGPFQLFQDGILLYRYDSGDAYISTIAVPLRPASTVNLTFYSQRAHETAEKRLFPAAWHNSRLLLATQEHSADVDRIVMCINAGTIGLYVLVIFYSLSLYAKKRSESYLLLLCGLAMLALLSSFTNSNLVSGTIGILNAPIRYLRLLLCIVVSFRLMNLHLPGRWDFLLTWRGMFLITALFCLLDSAGFYALVNELCYLSVIPCCVVCVLGLHRRIPGAPVLAIGTALREGMRIYFRLLLGNYLSTPEFFYHFYIPQAYNLLFVLCCIVIVNGLFARKFQEADDLAARQRDLNLHLDALVRERTAELKCSNEQLLEAQQRKHRMMTNIFHDLRTPIFCAQGSADMIEATDSASQKRLDVLKDRLDYLAHMAQELFALAGIEERSNRLELFRIRSEVLCEPVAAAAQIQSEQVGITFSSAIERGLCFSGDAYQMKRALDNLLSNALKFTPTGGSVHFAVRAQEGNILFQVSDTGPGLTAEEQSHIFERAYRSGGFSGFGLPIAAAIATAHHGSISVVSAPETGAEFTIRLPLETETGA